MEKIFEFFKEMSDKHKTPIRELNVHIDAGKIYVQKYNLGGIGTELFKVLEIIDLKR